MKPVTLPGDAKPFQIRKASSATFYQEGMTQAEFLEFVNANKGEWYLAWIDNKTKRPAQQLARLEGLEIAVVDKAPGVKATSRDKRWDIYVRAVGELDLDTFFAQGGEPVDADDDEPEAPADPRGDHEGNRTPPPARTPVLAPSGEARGLSELF
jgi:hypothetical protein